MVLLCLHGLIAKQEGDERWILTGRGSAPREHPELNTHKTLSSRNENLCGFLLDRWLLLNRITILGLEHTRGTIYDVPERDPEQVSQHTWAAVLKLKGSLRLEHCALIGAADSRQTKLWR